MAITITIGAVCLALLITIILIVACKQDEDVKEEHHVSFDRFR